MILPCSTRAKVSAMAASSSFPIFQYNLQILNNRSRYRGQTVKPSVNLSRRSVYFLRQGLLVPAKSHHGLLEPVDVQNRISLAQSERRRYPANGFSNMPSVHNAPAGLPNAPPSGE